MSIDVEITEDYPGEIPPWQNESEVLAQKYLFVIHAIKDHRVNTYQQLQRLLDNEFDAGTNFKTITGWIQQTLDEGFDTVLEKMRRRLHRLEPGVEVFSINVSEKALKTALEKEDNAHAKRILMSLWMLKTVQIKNFSQLYQEYKVHNTSIRSWIERVNELVEVMGESQGLNVFIAEKRERSQLSMKGKEITGDTSYYFRLFDYQEAWITKYRISIKTIESLAKTMRTLFQKGVELVVEHKIDFWIPEGDKIGPQRRVICSPELAEGMEEVRSLCPGTTDINLARFLIQVNIEYQED